MVQLLIEEAITSSKNEIIESAAKKAIEAIQPILESSTKSVEEALKITQTEIENVRKNNLIQTISVISVFAATVAAFTIGTQFLVQIAAAITDFILLKSNNGNPISFSSIGTWVNLLLILFVICFAATATIIIIWHFVNFIKWIIDPHYKENKTNENGNNKDSN